MGWQSTGNWPSQRQNTPANPVHSAPPVSPYDLLTHSGHLIESHTAEWERRGSMGGISVLMAWVCTYSKDGEER